MSFKKFLMGATAAVALTAGTANADVLFWSTQAKPVEETQAMREQVLAGAGQAVDYQANDGGPFITRLNAEIEAGTGTIGLLGALHGDFAAMDAANLVDLSDMDTTGVNATFLALGKLGTDTQYYMPWHAGVLHHGRQQKGAGILARGC